MCLAVILLSVVSAVIPYVGREEISDILGELDKTIDRREQFSLQKERRIINIKDELSAGGAIDSFYLCHRLFDEYKYYQYDSAYVYARKLESMALESGRKEDLAVAESALLFCFKSVGFFNEAVAVIEGFEFRLLGSGNKPDFRSGRYHVARQSMARMPDRGNIQVHGDILGNGDSKDHGEIPDRILLQFYMLCAETYQNLSSYVSGSADLARKYDKEKLRYYEKALSYAAPDSYDHACIRLELDLAENYSEDLAVNGRKRLIDRYDLSEHDYAVQYSILSSALGASGFLEESVYYRTLSAIYDIRSCTRETTSAKALAEYFYGAGEISRAYRYISQALYDARFYNSRLRMIEINAVLPKIENSRYDWLNNQRMLLLLCTAAFLLLLSVISVLFVKLHRRQRQLTEAHETLLRNTDLIKAQNDSLSQLNMKLKEANEIKDEYIIQSLYGNSQFVNEVEKQSTFAVRKILTRQYDDAVELLHHMGIRKERERVYSSFDSAFLKLFPNFIDEFNSLFPEENRISLEDGSLPMEVRIFALLRLGIDNTASVAESLNLSVNTVYVYKTKVKSRSSVPKDEFENRIRAIPKP